MALTQTFVKSCVDLALKLPVYLFSWFRDAIPQDSYLKKDKRTLQCFAHCMYAKKYRSFRVKFKAQVMAINFC